MPRATLILRQCRKALEDLELLKVLQYEIKHELSCPAFQNRQSGSLGDFVVESDSSESQDVVLKKKCESGEEIVVSALFGQENFVDGCAFPREVLMKVCVKKPGLSSILLFDCGIYEKGTGGSGSLFDILGAYYLPLTTCPKPSAYRGPFYSSLDPGLQMALRKYLVAKGISERLTNFLLLHLHKKEQGQYVKWLQILESLMAKGE